MITDKRDDDFNPRTPYGMRQEDAEKVLKSAEFQSTHPLRDATNDKFDKDAKLEISIHAPLTGCDDRCMIKWYNVYNFNPRTPYGMRQIKDGIASCLVPISIHAPLTGCDRS